MVLMGFVLLSSFGIVFISFIFGPRIKLDVLQNKGLASYLSL